MEVEKVIIYFIPDQLKKYSKKRLYNVYVRQQEKLELELLLRHTKEVFDLNLDSVHEAELLDTISRVKAFRLNGEVTNYRAMFSYWQPRNGKYYLVYTDLLKDEEKKLRVFVIVFDARRTDPFLGYPKDVSEWKEICMAIDSILKPQKQRENKK